MLVDEWHGVYAMGGNIVDVVHSQLCRMLALEIV